MSDTPKFNATEMDIHSPFNACQHRGYCQSLLAELADARAEIAEKSALIERCRGLYQVTHIHAAIDAAIEARKP